MDRAWRRGEGIIKHVKFYQHDKDSKYENLNESATGPHGLM